MATFEQQDVRVRGQSHVLVNRVLRQTYMLLSATLIFSALMAGFAMAIQAPPVHWILLLAGYFGLLFWVNAARNSSMGLVAVFALTGFLGFTIGPILSFYLTFFSNGAELIMLALGGTGLIFFGLSSYTITTGKDLSGMGKAVMIGMVVFFVAGIANIFLQMPALAMVVSAGFIIVCSMLIMFQTSQIIHGGERNYIMATVTLYLALYNIFLSLLQLLAVFVGNRE